MVMASQEVLPMRVCTTAMTTDATIMTANAMFPDR